MAVNSSIFPQEIWVRIFSYPEVDAQTLCRCAQVNKLLYKASTDKRLWLSLLQRDFPHYHRDLVKNKEAEAIKAVYQHYYTYDKRINDVFRSTFIDKDHFPTRYKTQVPLNYFPEINLEFSRPNALFNSIQDFKVSPTHYFIVTIVDVIRIDRKTRETVWFSDIIKYDLNNIKFIDVNLDYDSFVCGHQNNEISFHQLSDLKYSKSYTRVCAISKCTILQKDDQNQYYYQEFHSDTKQKLNNIPPNAIIKSFYTETPYMFVCFQKTNTKLEIQVYGHQDGLLLTEHQVEGTKIEKLTNLSFLVSRNENIDIYQIEIKKENNK